MKRAVRQVSRQQSLQPVSEIEDLDPCIWAATIQSRRIRTYVPHDDGAGQFSVGRSRSHSLATAVARTPGPANPKGNVRVLADSY